MDYTPPPEKSKEKGTKSLPLVGREDSILGMEEGRNHTCLKGRIMKTAVPFQRNWDS
jgi:hypothetical protein